MEKERAGLWHGEGEDVLHRAAIQRQRSGQCWGRDRASAGDFRFCAVRIFRAFAAAALKRNPGVRACWSGVQATW